MRRFALIAPLALLWVMTVAMPEAGAFEQWSGDRNSGNCADCHGNFQTSNYTSRKDGTVWGTSLHNGHRSTMLNGDCNTCHSAGGRFPVILNSSAGGTGLDPISCVGCHGRTEDLNNGQIGAGLRQHHTSAGAAFCGGCHVDNDPATFITAAEDTPPPYYFTPDTAHPNKPTDACNANGSESVFGAVGLDNDGDLLDDGADSDCAGNAPPVADANGPYSGTEGAPVTFDGSGSTDPDGTIVAYDWNFGDGNTGTGVSPSHTYAAAGTYAVTLTVTDDAGDTDTDSTTATIGAGNLAPTADANGPYTGTVGVPVMFDGSGSTDRDGTIVAYDWDFGDGNTGTGVSPMHTYASDGTFNVTLTVTDDGGLTDSNATTATIGPALVPPVADADGPYGGTAGQPVIFDGSGSTDPDGTIVAYDWDFGDGNTGSGVSPTHTYAADGTFAVRLTVTDNDGLTDFNETTAVIGPAPEPPVADANGPYAGTVGVPLTFDGTGSNDPDGTIVAYDWDFGDGNFGTGPTPTHTYAMDGVYTVSLTVTDNDGLIDSDNTTATIGNGPKPPVADPNGPYIGMVGMPVQFDGSGSTDPNGNNTIVSYDWDFGDGNTGSGVSPMHTYAGDGVYNVALTVTDDTGLADSASTTATISDVPPMEVSVKVPGAINPANNGVTPVKFWAEMMDLEIAAVTCGPAMAEPERLNIEDVNDDGYMDVVGLFRTGDLGIACGDVTLTCQGTLVGDGPFTASTMFKTVGPDCKPAKPMWTARKK